MSQPGPVDPALAQMFARFAGAKPLKDSKLNFIRGTGRHLFALVNYGPKMTSNGVVIAWKLLTLESQHHAPGEVVDASARLWEPLQWKREQEEARGADFVLKLVNPAGNSAEIASQLAAVSQPGRGILIVCHSTMSPKKGPVGPGKDPNYTEARWEHIPHQPGEQIAKLRAHIESTVDARHLAPFPMTAPQTQGQPQPSYVGAPMAAPMQPPPQYGQPAPQQPGYAPHTVAGYPMQGYAQPAAAAPMQPPIAPPPPAQPAAPAGGFLAGILNGGGKHPF